MTLPDILQYSLISALLSHHHRSFPLPQMGTNAERPTARHCTEREWESWEHSTLSRVSLSNPSPRGSGTLWKRKQKNYNSQRGQRAPRKTPTSRGLERWLRGQEHWLLFWRSLVQFPESTWQFTNVCNCGARWSDTLIQTYMQNKNKNKKQKKKIKQTPNNQQQQQQQNQASKQASKQTKTTPNKTS